LYAPGIYTKLLDVDKVDLVVSGYGTNLIVPLLCGDGRPPPRQTPFVRATLRVIAMTQVMASALPEIQPADRRGRPRLHLTRPT